MPNGNGMKSSEFHEAYAAELHAFADAFHDGFSREWMHDIARRREKLAENMKRIENNELELMRYPKRWW